MRDLEASPAMTTATIRPTGGHGAITVDASGKGDGPAVRSSTIALSGHGASARNAI